ncbi:hypothetical protein L1047_00475 [Synechococcus sp. Nb3U1]|uniref:hypothetical protein n=1 Tax=Synechococcus sp. Nb3U1 TaxID=1914529 RepID=UPI001F1DF6AF|nr:hypothetical protein [Synechococcus sp. Nb3U1]MCF2969672.1 hypothetical protein [Synechococcus sp. Nb3U1]
MNQASWMQSLQTVLPWPSLVLSGVLLVGAIAPVAAQEFEFTPPGQPAQPAVPSEGSVPTLPLLTAPPPETSAAPPALPAVPQVPQLGSDPAAPVLDPSTAPIPVVPLQAAPDPQAPLGEAYSYQRQPGVSPGGDLSGMTRGELPSGTTIPLTVYREITFQPYQTINGNLEVSDPVVDRFGQVVIPAGSVVWGTFEPVYREIDPLNRVEENADPQERIVGSRFVANRITIGSSTYLLSGRSPLLRVGLDRNADVGTTVARGAGYGAAGGLALGVLTGGIGFLPILAGGVAGAAAGSTNIDRVVTLQPNTLVELELADSLIIQ